MYGNTYTATCIYLGGPLCFYDIEAMHVPSFVLILISGTSGDNGKDFQGKHGCGLTLDHIKEGKEVRKVILD